MDTRIRTGSSPAAPPSGDPGPASLDRTFPAVQMLEVLEAWHRDPGPHTAAPLEAALLDVVEVAGARGAALEVKAPPLPAFEVAVGTLSDHAPAGQQGIRPFTLGGHDSRPSLGVLYLDAPGPKALAIARAIELALEAAWSRAQMRTRADRLAALDAATRAIAAELDIDRVLQLIVDRVRELVGARYAALGIADVRGRIERFVTSGMAPEDRAAIGPVPNGRGLLGLIIRDGRTVRVDDISRYPAAHGFPPHHPPMTTFLGTPIVLKGRSVGNLYLTDKAGDEPFTVEDERLVEMFAVHAAIAIDNARLHDLVQRMAVVEERERIAKDLHDGIIQAIYAVGLSLEDVPDLVEDDRVDAVARIDRAIDALNLVIADIRSYILRLRPTLDNDEDVVESLARLGEEFQMHAMVDLEVDLEDGARRLRDLPPDRRSDLLFIAREALSNVARHAAASRAELTLAGDAESLVLTVADNGRGFDLDDVAGPDALGHHQGLHNMRDRAVAMGGTFAVGRAHPSGTRIIVRVPASPDPGAPEGGTSDRGER